MDRVIYTAMSGAKHAFLRQAGVANNLANATSTGYRAQEHQFRAVPVQSEGYATRAFVVDASVQDVFDQGATMFTGRSLDAAIQGKGWFAVQTADGKEAYTRDGNFQVNANGQLQTKAGLNVVGEGGPITVPPDSRVTIGPDGTVSVVSTYGVPNTVNTLGRLKLVNPPENQLTRGADGLFRTRDGQEQAADPAVSLATETLEGSNVNVVDAMVSLISISRQFETQIKLVQTAEQMDKSAQPLLTLSS